MAASLPANASWLRTTPFGCPVLPDVNRTYAESALTGGGTRPADGDGQSLGAGPPVCPAPVRAISAATTGGGVARCTGTTTPPARHTPSIAATSPAWLDTGTTAGIPGRRPAARSRAASESAADPSWR